MKQLLIYKGKILAIKEKDGNGNDKISLITVSGISQDTDAEVTDSVLALEAATVDVEVLKLDDGIFNDGVLTI